MFKGQGHCCISILKFVNDLEIIHCITVTSFILYKLLINEITLRKMVNEHQTDWDNFIDGALFSQRTKPHSSTKFSPFYLLYGREAVYPSQLPKDFCGDIPKEPEKMDIEAHVSEQIQKKINTAKVVKDNISTAHKKQQRDYEKRVKKGRQHNDFKVDDKVLALNTKKTSTRKGNLESNYLGPYFVESIKGKTAILRTKTNEVLKKKFSVDNLKVFKTSLVDEICETEGYQKSADTMRSETADQYIRDISDSGCLQDLIKLILKLQHSKPKNSTSLQLLYDCPQQSFIQEVSEDAEEDVELYATKLLPYLRNLPVNLSQKTTMTMLLASVCVKASKLFENVLRIAETLKEKPGHLQDINESRPLERNERLVVGGETLEEEDLTTLQEGQWLNDKKKFCNAVFFILKVINAYLGLLKKECNITELNIFVLPSYTAVLWQNGNLFQWMFKKVKFSLYRFIMMPININDNHWILMVVNVKELSVTVLDSMNGQKAENWISLWRKFMEKRNSLEDISEKLGPWVENPLLSSKQRDGNSCGVFALMNAECLVHGVHISIMRQVHCRAFRQYVKDRLITSGSTKDEKLCDMPGCCLRARVTRWVQCCVCGRWLHTKCCGVSVKAALEEEFVCCICQAVYS
ncbi:hypothetical protein KUTeg_015839 [Tegillarca granosa]|uniref:Ubiquitin-like protease family profile domain-containing protein n=1 Tax=Tegillarca granosa TaxID=220873 RepID=A0ABQ9EKD8_TEGGR|nr:hypothetical protein KUTeg_015839 [Tegillarca granosa]